MLVFVRLSGNEFYLLYALQKENLQEVDNDIVAYLFPALVGAKSVRPDKVRYNADGSFFPRRFLDLHVGGRSVFYFR